MDKYELNDSTKILDNLSQDLSETAQNELHLIHRVKHENVIRYFDDFEIRLHESDYVCIIIEYCEVITIKIIKSLNII